MNYDENDLEDKLVLKKFNNKLRIVRIPERFEVNRTYPGGDEKGQSWPYGGVVPGRKHYPTDKSIPLEIYCGRKRETKPTGALVRITFQQIIKVGTGKITNIEYIITEVKE